MNGNLFTISAESDWSVRTLKSAVEKLSGQHPSKQKLVTNEGVILSQDFEPLFSYGSVEQLTLVLLRKSEAEEEWLQRWGEMTPQWKQRWCEEILDNNYFAEMRAEKEAEKEPPKIPRSQEAVKTEVFPRLETGASVLRAMASVDQLVQAGREIELLCFRHGESQKATVNAVLAAVEEAPARILPYVDYDVAMMVVRKLPNTFDFLQEDLQDVGNILFAALDIDDDLRTSFLRTASKKEINEWKWHLQEEKQRKRRAAK